MDGEIAAFSSIDADSALLASVADICRADVPREFAALNFSAGIDAWMRGVFACNQYVDEQAPWALRKTDPERMRAVLQTLFMAIRDLTVAILPVVPTTAHAVLDQLGIPKENRSFAALADSEWYAARVAMGVRISAPVAAFPRLDLPLQAEPA
jgi:methionyl-tRNA synthetase